jgi:phage tail sheath protein FI
MPVNPTYPGVYIQELPSGVRTIVGVSTSVAAFVDSFARGPLNRAIQIFNFGDFQREFGGLRADSEASYGIRQFFLNGGATAHIVRVASGAFAAASTVLEDGSGSSVLEAFAGRRIKQDSVEDPGEWGNNLRIDIDYNTTDPATLFNLTVNEIEIQNGSSAVVNTESFRNLSMTEGAANYAIEVVNESSKLIQLRRDAAWPFNRPAQTGTWGTDATGAEAALADGDTFDIGGIATAEIVLSGTPANLQEVRTILQSAIRAAGASLSPPEPLLTGATVQLIGTQFRVLAGRSGPNFDPATVLSFSDNTGTPATDLGLVSAFGNVQQYALGDTTAVAAQGAGTEGNDGSLPSGTDLRGIRDPDKSGIYALEDVDIFNILCIPRAADLTATAMADVVSEAQAYCLERRAFMIVDLPADIDTLQEARDWLDDNAGLRHRNAAAYFPRPLVPDPLNDFRLRPIAASGTIAGQYARSDSERGVWKAPAGIEAALRGVPDLAYRLSDPEHGQLNPLGLNALRNFDVFGNVCWGARTLVGADVMASEWKYVPIRRLALFLEESLFRGTQWVVFEPNDEPLWAQIRLNVGAFMHNLFRQGAFQGSTPREAYLVKCDSETTTQNDIDQGIVNILVGFAPLKPAEFVIIQIQQLAGQIET